MIDNNDPRLTAFVLGELSDDEMQLIAAAADASPELQQSVAEIESTTLAITAAFECEAHESRVGLSGIQKQELTEALIAAKPVPSDSNNGIMPQRSGTRRAVSRSRVAALAACLIAALTCGIVLTLAMQRANRDPFAWLSNQTDVPQEGEDNEYENLPGWSWHTTQTESWEDIGLPKIEGLSPNVSQDQQVVESGQAPTDDTGGQVGLGDEPALVFSDPDKFSKRSRRRAQFPAIDSLDRRTPPSGTRELAFEQESDVDTFTFDESITTQRATDEDSIDLLIAESSVGQEEGKGSLEASASLAPLRLNARSRSIDLRVSPETGTAIVVGDPDDVERVKQQLSRELSSSAGQQTGETAELFRSVPALIGGGVEIRENADTGTLILSGDPDDVERVKQQLARVLQGQENAPQTRNLLIPAGSIDVDEMKKKLRAALGDKILFIDDEEEQLEEGGQQRDKSANALKKAIMDQVHGGGQGEPKPRGKTPDKPRSWKRVNATGNTSRLIVGDKDELDMTGMQVQVQVDGFRARVLIDCFYYNDRDRQLEGNFKLRLPDDASLYYFAFGQSAYDFSPENAIADREFVDGNGQYVSMQPDEIGMARQDAWRDVKVARMVPREKAAFAYNETIRRRVDPALVEWSGAGVFNARVFPLMPHKLHRIVIGYDVSLTATDNGSIYRLDLPEQSGQSRVDLSVADIDNGKWQLHFEGGPADATADNQSNWESNKLAGNGKSSKRMRFDQPQWKSLTLTATDNRPVILKTGADQTGQFFATRIRADLPDASVNANPRAVFLLDTSLSSRPEKFNVWLDLMKATLENNRDSLKEFAVLFFDVDARFWREEFVANTTDNVRSLIDDCYQLGLEGATDLYGAMKQLNESDWISADELKPDLFLLSDGSANWGETNLHLIQHEFEQSGLGNLFAYQTGLSGTEIANLRFLSNAAGGAVFSVTSADEILRASTAHRKAAWELVSIQANGVTDILTAGRTQWVYPGQWLTVVGRGSPSSDLVVNLRKGTAEKSVTISNATTIDSDMAGRLYGHVAVGQLENLGNSIFDVAAAYSRHFRITGNTCSLLMLESEADYERFDIKPQEDWFVIQSKKASDVVAQELARNAELLADPKAQLINWIQRLESMPGLEFSMPTALKIVLDQMKIEAIDSRLDCQLQGSGDWSKKYVAALADENVDHEAIAAEADRRSGVSADDALKVYSNLIERNPGDWVVARDVAFTAMELDRPAAAYPLLRSVIRNRPFEGSTYAALGQCLAQLDKVDMAIVFYELALGCEFANQGRDFRKIVATEYASLLRRVVGGKTDSSVKEFALARMESLAKIADIEKCDLMVAMMWNTDQTDVDLHVIEPTGEECSYQNRITKIGGSMTEDIRNGFGPELYKLPSAANGEYEIQVKFYGSNQSRTRVSNKVHLTIYRNFASDSETIERKTIALESIGPKVPVAKIIWATE